MLRMILIDELFIVFCLFLQDVKKNLTEAGVGHDWPAGTLRRGEEEALQGILTERYLVVEQGQRELHVAIEDRLACKLFRAAAAPGRRIAGCTWLLGVLIPQVRVKRGIR